MKTCSPADGMDPCPVLMPTAALSPAACKTLQGAGEDVEDAGEAMEKTIET